jgi:hypothetical protein
MRVEHHEMSGSAVNAATMGHNFPRSAANVGWNGDHGNQESGEAGALQVVALVPLADSEDRQPIPNQLLK